MARLPEPNVAEMSEAEKEVHTRVLRKYAEFHRKLGLLLEEVVERETVYWTGAILEAQFGEAETRFVDTAVGHVLEVAKDDREADATHNVYHSALYALENAEVYQAALQDLQRLQSDVMALTGAKRPYDGLLEPLLLEAVDFVRLRAQRVNFDKVVTTSRYLEGSDQRLVGVRANAEKFERVNPHDAETMRLHQEIAQLEAVKERLETFSEAKVLERTHSLRVMAQVYRRSHKPKGVYIRNVGLMVAGPNLRVEVPARYRQRRSDRVTDDLIAPLASFENVSVYSYALWQERVRGKKA